MLTNNDSLIIRGTTPTVRIELPIGIDKIEDIRLYMAPVGPWTAADNLATGGTFAVTRIDLEHFSVGVIANLNQMQVEDNYVYYTLSKADTYRLTHDCNYVQLQVVIQYIDHTRESSDLIRIPVTGLRIL